MKDEFDGIIKAISHPLRREILQWLKEPHRYFSDQHHSLENGVCAGQIDQRAGLSQSTVSAHLATLQRAGLITTRKVGQWHFFKRNEPTIEAFLSRLVHEL
jgi:ArsR family transcriptional regulator